MSEMVPETEIQTTANPPHEIHPPLSPRNTRTQYRRNTPFLPPLEPTTRIPVSLLLTYPSSPTVSPNQHLQPPAQSLPNPTSAPISARLDILPRCSSSTAT